MKVHFLTAADKFKLKPLQASTTLHLVLKFEEANKATHLQDK